MAQGYYGTEDNPLDGLHSERVVLTPHTSGEPDQYGMRLRTDLNSGDRIATVLVNNGSVGESPVFPDGTSTPSGIAEGPPVYVPGEGWGFIPILEQGGAFEEYVIWHDSTRYGVHDSLTALPDSVVNRWPIQSDGEDPIADVVGTDDGAVNGSPNYVSGTYIEGWALDLDGTDDYVDTGATMPAGSLTSLATVDFDANITDIQHVSSVQNTGNPGARMLRFRGDQSANRLEFFARSGEGNILSVQHDFSSTGTYRVAGILDTSSDELRIAVDGSVQSTTDVSGNTFSTQLSNHKIGRRPGDNERFYAHIVDEPMIADDAYSSSQLTEDYNRQPWS